jgi:hypothetical protein
MSDETGRRRSDRLSTIVAVGVAIYVAAYYATVTPYGRHAQGIGPWHSYRIGGRTLPDEAHIVFGPAHWLDRNARPATWWIHEEFPPVPLIVEKPSR